MTDFDKTAHAARPSWILFFGFMLAAIGLATSQDDSAGADAAFTRTIPMTGMGGTADSNDRMIAVTGVDVTGSSILYVIDTVDPHTAVYQATGGAGSMQGIEFVGARRIDLDLKLDGYNDKSDESFKSLEEKFIRNNLLQAGQQK